MTDSALEHRKYSKKSKSFSTFCLIRINTYGVIISSAAFDTMLDQMEFVVGEVHLAPSMYSVTPSKVSPRFFFISKQLISVSALTVFHQLRGVQI